MELEDLRETWKSIGPNIEKVSMGTSDILDLKFKTDSKTRLLMRCLFSLAISVVCVTLTLTSYSWAPMLFPMPWLVAFGIGGTVAIVSEIYLINMIRKVSLWKSSINEIMNAVIKIKKYYKNIELIFSIVFAILIGWIAFLPPFFGSWGMVWVGGALVITSMIEIRFYKRNIILINQLSESEHDDINQ